MVIRRMRVVEDFKMGRSSSGYAKLLEDFIIDLEKGYEGYHEFSSLTTGVFAILDNDELTIKAGYEWNECSPAFYFRGKRFGTICTRAESAASCIHDVAREVYRLACVPFDREDTDDFFYDALKLFGSRVRMTYYGAVSSFLGTFFIWITSGKMKCYCKTCYKQ